MKLVENEFFQSLRVYFLLLCTHEHTHMYIIKITIIMVEMRQKINNKRQRGHRLK